MSDSLIIPPGGGTDYDWSADHTFVKVGARDSGGAYTLMEDNLKPGFALGPPQRPPIAHRLRGE